MSNVGRFGDGDMEVQAGGGNAGGGEVKSTRRQRSQIGGAHLLCSGSVPSWVPAKRRSLSP